MKAGTVRVVSEGNKAAALGQIDENGEYLVSNAPIGKVQIALTKPEVPTGLDPTKGAGGQPDIGKGKDRLSKDSSTLPNIGLSADQVKSLQERAKTIENMPAIYSDPQKSGLTTTVVEGGASYDIIMKSSK